MERGEPMTNVLNLVRTARKLAGKVLRLPQRHSAALDSGPCVNPVAIELRQELLTRGELPAIVDPWLLELERTSQHLDRYEVLKHLFRMHPVPHQVNYLLGQ